MKKEVFQKIESPYFVAYYYKNEEEKDKVISIDAIQEFDASTQTPKALKQVMALPNVDSHVIISRMQSKDLESVRKVVFNYADETLNMKEVEKKRSPANGRMNGFTSKTS